MPATIVYLLPLIIASLVMAIPLCVLIVVIWKIANHFDGVANMYFAVTTMRLRLELDECGYEIPDWLKIDDDDEALEMPPPTDLKLIKLEKNKKEE